ncbi:uncharacterized protein SETTUDRAFT_19624 [Exserohilum turcica Et28A]|uniref:Uncharacterized protein n=1 Tax=Exserohilum turcicum (strain 28A) TaxID=671987 RepID=R0K1V2_EXST2|nr:uncharacterized protein SETTUDRAFT_19624 [Exserohilum turcica Et28A]EOA87108.1 hypothetical protein SETTUDRAFT_19624 [Exserohilum turcica Et28A]
MSSIETVIMPNTSSSSILAGAEDQDIMITYPLTRVWANTPLIVPTSNTASTSLRHHHHHNRRANAHEDEEDEDMHLCTLALCTVDSVDLIRRDTAERNTRRSSASSRTASEIKGKVGGLVGVLNQKVRGWVRRLSCKM